MKHHVFHQKLTDYVIRALKRVVIRLHGDIKMLGVVAAALFILTLFCWRAHTSLQPPPPPSGFIQLVYLHQRVQALAHGFD